MIHSIAAQGLSKRYRGAKQYALHNMSFAVAPSEVYGFLGANGAGKSTTIRLLLNFLQPTEGSATILGKDVVKDSVAIKQHIGYLAGDVALYDKMTGADFLAYMTELQPLRSKTYQKQLIHDFEAQVDKRMGTLSKGNRQKIGIIQAFMHEPEVLVLDEPTSGLDPLMQEVFFEHVKRAKARGASIFFSSHNLAEVQRICDRIGFVNQGKLIREQGLAELAHDAAHTFDLDFAGTPPVDELKKLGTILKSDAHKVSITITAHSLSAFFGILAKHELRQFQQREVNLEEEFMDYYREANNE